MPSSDCPEGYCSFDAIPEAVDDLGWKLDIYAELDRQRTEVWGESKSFFGQLSVDREHRVQQIKVVLARKLIGGDVCAASILESGDVVWVPKATWLVRVSACMGAKSAIDLAISTGAILIRKKSGASLEGRAIISHFELAKAIGVEKLPPRPVFQPKFLPEYMPTAEGRTQPIPLKGASSGNGGSDPIQSWMNKHAQEFKETGKTIKRDDAIRTAKQALGCSYREAEAAYEALPYPELRHAPRTRKE